MSQIVVLCETPIQWEQSSLVYFTNTCSIWYFAQLACNVIFMNLHGPAGACILVASVSPIHVLPIQCVLKHCGVHIYIYIHMHVVKTMTPQLVGFAHQLGCKKL